MGNLELMNDNKTWLHIHEKSQHFLNKNKSRLRQEPAVALTEVPGDGLDASTRRKDDKT